MTDSPALEPGETLRAEARATFYVTRMVAQAGHLYLTDRRLLFEPSGRLEQALGGGYPATIGLDEIQHLECEGSGTRRLVIRTAIQSFRFVGRDFEPIERHLREVLAARDPGDVEEVLATTKVHLYVSRMVTQSGQLYLTNRRVSFLPVGVLDRAVGAREISLKVEDVIGVVSEGSLDRRTALRGRARSLVFLGQLPPIFLNGLREALAARGRGLIEERSDEVRPPRGETPEDHGS